MALVTALLMLIARRGKDECELKALNSRVVWVEPRAKLCDAQESRTPKLEEPGFAELVACPSENLENWLGKKKTSTGVLKLIENTAD